MTKARPYTGTKDGAAKAKRPGTEKFVDLCHRRWNTKNLGTWVVRDMRGKPGQLSVHATGRALDIQFPDKATKMDAVAWFETNAYALGLEEIHVYDAGKWGKGWRTGRGWKTWTETDNGGTPGAAWLHVEICPEYANDAALMETQWRAIPKPNKG